MQVVYEFGKIPFGKVGRYIVQVVKGRRLTDICHSHDFYEVLYMVCGSAVQQINGTACPMEKGEAVLLCPGDTHWFSEQAQDVVLLSFSVEREEFCRVAALYGDARPWEGDPRPFFGGEHLAYLQRFTDETCRNESDCCFLLACVLKAYIDRRTVSKPLPRLLSEAVEEMKRESNLRAGIPAFVALSCYSQSQLSRLTRRYFGQTPKQYINELRMQAARREILFGDRAVPELAESLGFSGFSHFNKLFKARFGMTPAAMRRQNSVRTV